MHILVLADSYNSITKYHNAITTIRRGSRWLQGRGSPVLRGHMRG